MKLSKKFRGVYFGEDILEHLCSQNMLTHMYSWSWQNSISLGGDSSLCVCEGSREDLTLHERRNSRIWR